MSSIVTARRRRRLLLASSFLAPIVAFGISGARAQQIAAADPLPAIEVNPPGDQNRTRARPSYDEGSGTRRVVAPNPRPSSNPDPAPGAGSNVASEGTGQGGETGGRQFSGIVGASATVITAEQIAHSPSHTLSEIIAQVPGVQLQSLYGGVNGAKTSVDLRGFGATAMSNTLILVNGRRMSDIDITAIDLSTIPLNAIERIEITRGNSGAVL